MIAEDSVIYPTEQMAERRYVILNKSVIDQWPENLIYPSDSYKRSKQKTDEH